jgi:hypothetical protein
MSLLHFAETCLNELTLNIGCASADPLIEPDGFPDVLEAELVVGVPVTCMVWPTCFSSFAVSPVS